MKKSLFLLVITSLFLFGFTPVFAETVYVGDGTYIFAPEDSVLLDNDLTIKPRAISVDGFASIVFDVYQDLTELGTTEIRRLGWEEKIFYLDNNKAFGAEILSYEYPGGIVNPEVKLRSVSDEVNVSGFSLIKDYNAIMGSYATFSWTTDVAAKGKVEYCKNEICSNPEFFETSGANSKIPSILIGELEEATFYYYRIISTTPGGATDIYPESGWDSFISSETNIIEAGLEVMQISFSGITNNSATVSWRADSLDGNGEYRYSTNRDELQELPWQSAGVINGSSSGMTFGSKVALSGLSSDTTYYVNVRKTLPEHPPKSLKAGVSKTSSFKTSGTYSPVQVVTPGAGHVYYTGSDINIELVNPSNYTEMTLELIKGSSVYETIGSTSSNVPLTFYHWPSASRTAPIGDDYKIRVYPTNDPDNFSESGIFSIENPSPTLYSAPTSSGVYSVNDIKPGWLVKNKKYAEVFYVDSNLNLRWIADEIVALKHFGPTWNQIIKEFDDIGASGLNYGDQVKEDSSLVVESEDDYNISDITFGWLIKNRRFAEVFYVNADMQLQWVVNEQAALKHFGPTWNQIIKEFDDLSSAGLQFGSQLN